MKKILLTYLLVLPFGLFAQINGKVIDSETNLPIENASIVFENSQNGTSSDSDGKFTLDNSNQTSKIIEISFIGYQKQKLTVSDQTGITVFLVPQTLEMNEIIISSNRITKEKSPSTATTLNAEEISKSFYAQDVPVLLSNTPNVTFYSENGNGIGYSYLSMRGFDQRRINITVNNIPQNDPEDHNVYWIDLPDLIGYTEDIQIQRGTTGSFLGSTGIGGNINLKTKQKSPNQSITFLSGAGSYNTQKYSVDYNSGLLYTKYAVNFKIGKTLSDGYRKHSNVDMTSYFLGLFNYGETYTLRFHAYGGPVKDNLAYNGLTKSDYETDRRENSLSFDKENYNQPHFEFIHDWNVSEKLNLSNSLYYVMGRGYFDIQYPDYWGYPFSEFGVNYATSGLNIADSVKTNYTRESVDNDQIGLISRLTYFSDSFTLTGGTDFRIHQSHHYKSILFSDGFPIEKTKFNDYNGGKKTISAFTTVEIPFSARFVGMVSLQGTLIQYKIDQKLLAYGPLYSFATPFFFFSPKFGVSYSPDEQSLLYLSLAYSSREPRLTELFDAGSNASIPNFEVTKADGANNPIEFDFNKPNVKPESVYNIELGGSYSQENSTHKLNFYYMQFENEIVKSGKLASYGNPVLGNAESSVHYGIELESMLSINANNRISWNFAASENRFIKHGVYEKLNSEYKKSYFNGNEIAGFPSIVANLSYSYQLDNFSANTKTKYAGKYFADNGNLYEIPSYIITDFSIFYDFGSWAGVKSFEVGFFANNVFNRLVISRAEMSNGEVLYFPAAERNFFAHLKIKI